MPQYGYERLQLQYQYTSGSTTYSGSVIVPPGYLDNWSSWSQPRAGSKFIKTPYGEEDSWYVADDYYLAMDVRFIRETTSTPSDIAQNGSVWNVLSSGSLGDVSWTGFLLQANRGIPVTASFGNTPTTVSNCYVVDSSTDGPTINQDGTRNIRITLRNKNTPFTGF